MGSCQQTITVTAAGAGTATTQSSSGTSQSTTTTTSQGTSNGATASLPSTGPNNLLLGLGAIGGGISLIGLILFFAL
jgi:hypothetical protein